MSGEKCTRKRLEILGNNYYVVVGKTFAQVTVPFENDPKRKNERIVAEGICDGISEILREENGE